MKVLFVEDNAMNRLVVKSMLEAAGVEVVEAESAEHGLQLLEINDYDLVLMDLRMPGMDGLTAIRKIRSGSGPKALVPIIVVTADSATNLMDLCREAGADDLLLKPISMEALFEKVGAVLANSGAAVELT